MEMENDVKTLESRLAQIEEWKRCKDDAEYRAKVKAENEYWEAVNNLKEYHKRIEDICALANKLYSYKIYCSTINGYNFVSLFPDEHSRNYKEYFGIVIKDSYGINTDHYILYNDNGFHYCSNRHDCVFKPLTQKKPEIEVLRKIYNDFPKFEEGFYKWFDEVIKIA